MLVAQVLARPVARALEPDRESGQVVVPAPTRVVEIIREVELDRALVKARAPGTEVAVARDAALLLTRAAKTRNYNFVVGQGFFLSVTAVMSHQR